MAKILGHRGASNLAPQNTKAAFEKAIELGVDGMEIDVHLSKDGELVVCHNYTIDETSNGKGEIGDLTLGELKQFDFGSYFSPEFEGERILTLDEFFEIAKDLEVLNVEIKAPRAKDNVDEIVEKTIACIKKFSVESQVIISSFSGDVLLKSKEVEPQIRTALLYDMMCGCCDAVCQDKIGYAKKLGIDGYHPMVLLVDEDYIKECHDNNLFVNVWTVNEKEAMERLISYNLDGIITDKPEIAKLVDMNE